MNRGGVGALTGFRCGAVSLVSLSFVRRHVCSCVCWFLLAVLFVTD
jgi:hypothetical protein